MNSWMIALGVLGGAGLFVAFRWLTKKSALDSASAFLKTRNKQYRDSNDY